MAHLRKRHSARTKISVFLAGSAIAGAMIAGWLSAGPNKTSFDPTYRTPGVSQQIPQQQLGLQTKPNSGGYNAPFSNFPDINSGSLVTNSIDDTLLRFNYDNNPVDGKQNPGGNVGRGLVTSSVSNLQPGQIISLDEISYTQTASVGNDSLDLHISDTLTSTEVPLLMGWIGGSNLSNYLVKIAIKNSKREEIAELRSLYVKSRSSFMIELPDNIVPGQYNVEIEVVEKGKMITMRMEFQFREHTNYRILEDNGFVVQENATTLIVGYPALVPIEQTNPPYQPTINIELKLSYKDGRRETRTHPFGRRIEVNKVGLESALAYIGFGMDLDKGILIWNTNEN